MKTSVEQILTRELVGREVLIYKYRSEEDFYFRLTSSSLFVASGYAKITECGLAINEDGLISIVLDIIPTETIDTRWVEINVQSPMELKEKED